MVPTPEDGLTTSDRLLAVLDLFTLDRADWTVDAAATTLGVPVSTTYRYFNSLTSAGLLTTFGGGRYGLGPAVIRYDRQLRLTDPLVLAAGGEMDRVARAVQVPAVVFLCRLFGDSVMCVAQVSVNDPPFAVGYARGRLMPLFAGSASRVILAGLAPRPLRALYQRQPAAFATAGFGSDWKAVRAALRGLREAGSCVTSGEIDAGVRGISVPVMGPGGVLGSLTVAGRRTTLPNAVVTPLITELSAAARAIERGIERIAASRHAT